MQYQSKDWRIHVRHCHPNRHWQRWYQGPSYLEQVWGSFLQRQQQGCKATWGLNQCLMIWIIEKKIVRNKATSAIKMVIFFSYLGFDHLGCWQLGMNKQHWVSNQSPMRRNWQCQTARKMNNDGRQNEKKKKKLVCGGWTCFYKPPQNDVCDRVDGNGLTGDNIGLILLGGTVASHDEELFL